MLQTRAVDPADINGSGSPVGGIRPVTTAIFKRTCIANKQEIPVAK